MTPKGQSKNKFFGSKYSKYFFKGLNEELLNSGRNLQLSRNKIQLFKIGISFYKREFYPSTAGSRTRILIPNPIHIPNPNPDSEPESGFRTQIRIPNPNPGPEPESGIHIRIQNLNRDPPTG
jgi:hypothetical protein